MGNIMKARGQREQTNKARILKEELETLEGEGMIVRLWKARDQVTKDFSKI